MANFVKWWKDKTFVTLVAVAVATVLLSFLVAYYIPCGWVLSMLFGIVGGLVMRAIIYKRLKEKEEE